MQLTEIALENYKSYFGRQVVKVEQGFNILLGGNNSGKTTLLEALDFDAGISDPHRSLQNLPKFGDQSAGFSTMGVRIETTLHGISDPKTRLVSLPIPTFWYEGRPAGSRPDLLAMQSLDGDRHVRLNYEFGSGRSALSVASAFGDVRIESYSTAPYFLIRVEAQSDGSLIHQNFSGQLSGMVPPLAEMLSRLSRNFYRFSANRRPAGACGQSQHPVTLAPDASNLAYCLNYLQSTDAHGHRLLCELTNRIFPGVHWVQASPRPANQFEIECLPAAPEARRHDLAVPLVKMGSGIGNVIAMLYVVLTAREPMVIAIDEPNSFLHPRALRELLQILATKGGEHQYLLTAHSADVLTAVPPSLVTVFELDDGATTTTQVRALELTHIRAELSDLGIRMTDLHGRDRVLWVEGQTEELVIPQLLQHFCPEVAPGTAVLRVEHTGLFEKKKVNPVEVADLYRRLTTSTALVPPMVGILLDREKRRPDECAKLDADSGGCLKFLDRTMLENYVLHAGAIGHLLREHGEQTDDTAVAASLTRVLQPGGEVSVDGAKVLASAFDEFTGARTEFKKTRDVPKLMTWLLENDRAFLAPLGAYLRTLFALPPV